MDILELAEFTSLKALKAYLKEHSIPFSFKYGRINFDYSFWDTAFTVSINHVKDIVTSYTLSMSSAESEYLKSAENMLKIKGKLTAILGRPTRDNTNHLNMNEIEVQFEKNGISCRLLCLNDCEFEYKTVFLSISNEKSDTSAADKPKNIVLQTITAPLVTCSFIGGIFWGLAMYGLMGAATQDYSLFSFGLWMLGGLLFGVLFAIVFGVSEQISARKPKYNYKKLYKSFHLEQCSDVYPGNGICRSVDEKGRFRVNFFPTLMQVSDSGIVVYYLIKNKPCSQGIPLADACKGLIFGHTLFAADNKNCEYDFRDYSIGKQIEDDLCSRVIDQNKYYSLFECFRKVFVEYNPYSLYHSNDSEILDKEIGTLVNAFLISDTISEEDVLSLLSDPFSFGDYTSEALSGLLREAFTDWKHKYEVKE